MPNPEIPEQSVVTLIRQTLATESEAGSAEIATQDEVDTGTDNQRFIVPAKLKAWWDSVRTWANIKDKPTDFPPSNHSHSWSSVTDKPVFKSAAFLDAGQSDGQVARIGDPAGDGQTSVVVASGSNAYGNYRIWSDGTIEQWGLSTVHSDAINTLVIQPFPIPFNVGGIVSLTPYYENLPSSSTAGDALMFKSPGSKFTVDFRWARVTGLSSGLTYLLDWRAIGK